MRPEELISFRAEAERARQIAERFSEPDLRARVLQLARDYEEVAEDIENGTSVTRHPELLPQGGAGE